MLEIVLKIFSISAPLFYTLFNISYDNTKRKCTQENKNDIIQVLKLKGEHSMIIRLATIKDLDYITNVEKECFPVEEAATRDSFEERLHVQTISGF